MRTLKSLALAALIAGGMIPHQAAACSVFLIKAPGGVVMAKNLDWHYGGGVVTVNKRNVLKKSFFLLGQDNPLEWASRYGSVTFNQHGREMPLGGMNEAGLMVEVLWLDAAKYPEKDARLAVGILQWVQYQLDNFADVAGVAANADKIRVEDSKFPLHYFACDKTGACAAFEYLDGRLVVHTGASMSVATLTNDSYERSTGFLAQYAGFGGNRPLPQGEASLARFVRAAAGAKAFGPASGSPVAYAFTVLDDVRQTREWQGNNTTWQIVYEPSAGRIHFRTAADAAIKTVDAKGFDYSCLTPVEVLDMNSSSKDPSKDFGDYSQKANEKQAVAGLKAAFRLPAFMAKGLVRSKGVAGYPETTRCLETRLSPGPSGASTELERLTRAPNWP